MNTQNTDQLFIDSNSNLTGGALIIGTREEWEKGMRTSLGLWYEEYLQVNEDESNILTLEAWINDLLDYELEEVEEDDDITEFQRIELK
jgi:hypothetical protein